jgi:hypothetical protein
MDPGLPLKTLPPIPIPCLAAIFVKKFQVVMQLFLFVRSFLYKFLTIFCQISRD